MSPETTVAPSLLASIPPDVIKACFTSPEGHPRVVPDDLEIRTVDGTSYLLVKSSQVWFEIRRPATRSDALSFIPTIDPTRAATIEGADRGRRQGPPEILTIPGPPPLPASLEREAAAALAALEKAKTHLDGQGERLGALLEYPVLETWPILDAVQHVRRLVEGAVTVQAALGDLEAALAWIEGPRSALRTAVEAATRPVAVRNPLYRATAPRPVSETQRLLDRVEESVRDGRGAAQIVRDAWASVVGRLRTALDQDVPTVRAMFDTHERALRARIGHAVDQARAQGHTTIDYITLVRNEETGLVGLHNREQDLAGLVRDLERLTRE